MNVITLCRYDGCRRAATYPDQARCEEHRLRWMPGRSVEQPRRPAWIERMAVNSKDFTGSVA